MCRGTDERAGSGVRWHGTDVVSERGACSGCPEMPRRRRARHQTTTLYWHIGTKNDVVDLAVDAIFAETSAPQGHTDDWQSDISSLLTSWRATLLRHPWTAALAANRRPLLGPEFLA
ncbi:TetR/AcrR family transcriptional regulator C-terminal domain-containing protein [Rhodococcus sp. NPDC058521]|uniref:TetR/AcrR family transcriptional regulator C-terminal domain-containing protein n=1 Tax=Rhodococcus sp. NPDC058521 TaxID=3346536 RepID=UPI003650056C